MAALLFVNSIILLDLSIISMLKARFNTTSSPKYRFCFNLTPSIEEKVLSFRLLQIDAGSKTAFLIPTMLFYAKLLTAIYILQLSANYVTIKSLVIVYMRSFYGNSINKLITSNFFITIPFSISAIQYSSKQCCFLNFYI